MCGHSSTNAVMKPSIVQNCESISRMMMMCESSPAEKEMNAVHIWTHMGERKTDKIPLVTCSHMDTIIIRDGNERGRVREEET